jgi:protoporphyrinogen oxidase
MLANFLPEAVAQAVGKLRHNSVLIVNLGVRGAHLTDRHWVYLPEKKYTAYRVGCYSNFSAQLAQEGTSSFYVEIAYRKEWNVDKEELVAKAIHEMVEIGLIRKLEDIIIKDVADLECAYVIYDENHAESRRTIKDHLAGLRIASIGRYGNWEYSGMEEALMQGRDAVC